MVVTKAHCTHAIFDMDGLLLDTEKFYTVVSQQIAGRFDKEFTWELKAKQMGKKAIESCTLFVNELGLQGLITPEQVLADREEGLDMLFPTAQLLPGAEKLLRHLHKHEVPIALATSSNKRHYELKTTNHKELFSLFNVKLTGDDVKNGKPNPEIFLCAASKFQLAAPPEKCLVFEDAPSGVQAGKAAGMHVVMVPDAQLAPDLTAGADQILKTLEDFDPSEWGFPPYD